MPSDTPRTTSAGKRRHLTGVPHAGAHDPEETELPFDPGWLNLAITACPVCGGTDVDWQLRGSPGWPAPAPGELTDFIRPADPGHCPDCHSMGDANTPGRWDLSRGLSADQCPYCAQPPIGRQHLPDIDGKHRMIGGPSTILVPADGHWYRYHCPGQHWWISAPAFTTVPAVY